VRLVDEYDDGGEADVHRDGLCHGGQRRRNLDLGGAERQYATQAPDPLTNEQIRCLRGVGR
jgi:hypothetical protein